METALKLPVGKMNEILTPCPYCMERPVEMVEMKHWQTNENMFFSGGYCGHKECQKAYDHDCDEFDRARKGE
jgi:hypothetical protein